MTEYYENIFREIVFEFNLVKKNKYTILDSKNCMGKREIKNFWLWKL